MALCLASTIGFAQTTSPQPAFSQSVMYAPRELPADNSKSRKQKDGTPASIVPVAAPIKEGPMTIPVSVLDGTGKIVGGLQKGNFRVFIDKTKVDITSVEIRPDTLNIILLVDTSPSTLYTSAAMQDVATAIVGELDELDRVSIIRFESDVKPLSELTDDRETLRRAIRNIKLGISGTALYDAMRYVFEQKTPAIEGQTVVFVLTDGVDTSSKIATYASSLELAEQSDVTIIPVFFDTQEQNSKDVAKAHEGSIRGGISGAISAELLEKAEAKRRAIAAEHERGKMYLNDLIFLSGGRALAAKSFENAPKETAAQLIAELRQRYMVTFTPPGGGIGGQRRQILVRVDKPNLAVLARGSYFVKSKSL